MHLIQQVELETLYRNWRDMHCAEHCNRFPVLAAVALLLLLLCSMQHLCDWLISEMERSQGADYVKVASQLPTIPARTHHHLAMWACSGK
jgi:hypothetical protein